MSQFGTNFRNILNSHIDTPVPIAGTPERRDATLPPQSMQFRNVRCIPVPPPHKCCKTSRPVRPPQCPSPRFVSSFEIVCLVLSWPPPVFPFFLALPKCRISGHEIDTFSALGGISDGSTSIS